MLLCVCVYSDSMCVVGTLCHNNFFIFALSFADRYYDLILLLLLLLHLLLHFIQVVENKYYSKRCNTKDKYLNLLRKLNAKIKF